ncbi:MAG: O-antigen ligase family protein [Desulfobacterales bacterium]|nr:O-antigen ligase family protein [Desulfobacterales bacterium]
MINYIIKFILIGLIIFTPIAFGSVELWAFSLMELGILLIIILWSVQLAIRHAPRGVHGSPEPHMVQGAFRIPNSAIMIVFLSLFLLLILFQMLPLPSGIVKIISPNTYALRHSLTFDLSPLTSSYTFDLSPLTFHLSFVPFATRIEFFKWLTLSGFFFFLLHWRHSNKDLIRLIRIIMLVGIAESLYGMLELFSGHRYILNLDMQASAVTGTFINRNYFAGYLLMVIPLSIGYFFSREAFQRIRFVGWRHRLSSLDGKTLLIVFGIILMILGLLFSASRMGIISLLLSFSLISFLFRESQRGQRFSKTTVLIFGLAFLWAAWIGLDAVISRFFTVSEGFEERWRIWVDTFHIFKDFPLIGSGLGTFFHVFPMYRSFHIRGLVTHAENDFLQLLSEVGLIGIGLLLFVFAFLFFRAVLAIRSFHSGDSKKYIGIGGLVGILALMFHSLVERNIQVPANALLFAFIWALVLKISTKETREIYPVKCEAYFTGTKQTR